MKVKIFAVVTIISTILAVTLNTVFLHKDMDKIYNLVDGIDFSDNSRATEEARGAYGYFKKKEMFLGLTVNHDDLSNIEDCFSEMIGYLSVGDINGAIVTKSRLIDALGHLRRLSGLNIDAII